MFVIQFILNVLDVTGVYSYKTDVHICFMIAELLFGLVAFVMLIITNKPGKGAAVKNFAYFYITFATIYFIALIIFTYVLAETIATEAEGAVSSAADPAAA